MGDKGKKDKDKGMKQQQKKKEKKAKAANNTSDTYAGEVTVRHGALGTSR